MWSIIKEILETLSYIGTVGGLIFTGVQLLQVNKQLKETQKQSEQMNRQLELAYKQDKDLHEEQRRIKTIDVLKGWNDGLKKETRLAEKIVEKFSEEQCTKLYEYTPFEISEDMHKMVCQMCSKKKSECEKCKPLDNGKYLIDGSQLTELRGNVTSYLNNLEIVALAWQQGIVDRDAIEMQFPFLHQKGKKSALYNYRQIAGGGNSYPTLNMFYDKIVENKKPNIPKKKEQ